MGNGNKILFLRGAMIYINIKYIFCIFFGENG